MKLTERWAMVTGAGRGIGRGCAVELARSGADIVLNDRPDSDDVNGVRAEIEAFGRTCHVIRSDVFAREGRESLVSEAIEKAGRLDILISNPACNLRSGFLACDPGDFARVIDAALVSGFHVGQLVARHMVDRGAGGKLVFISSVHAALP